MTRTTSFLRLAFLPSQPAMRFAFASASKAQLRSLMAAIVLCAAIVAAAPAYSEGPSGGAAPIAASPDSEANHWNAQGPASETTKLNVQPETTIVAVVQPNIKTILDAYNEVSFITCASLPGTWAVKTPPKYGTVTSGVYVSTELGGPCRGHKIKYGVIYYTWTKTKLKPAPTKDRFVAILYAYKKAPETVTFDLTLK